MIDKIKTIRRTSVRGRSRGPRIYDRIKRSLWADMDLYAENAVETVTQKVFASSVCNFVRTTWQKVSPFSVFNRLDRSEKDIKTEQQMIAK